MHDAAAKIQYRALRLVDHLCRASDQIRPRCRCRISRSGFRPFANLNGLVLHVLWNIDKDRAGASGSSKTECARNGLKQFLRRTNQEIVLGDRDAQAVGVDFLKRVGTDHRFWHLPGDCDHRDRIQLGIGNGRQQIGRARARRRQADRHLSGGPCHSLGDEAGALLMPSEYMMDRRRLRQGIVYRQYRAAGYAGQRSHALPFEQAYHNLCAGKGFTSLASHHYLLSQSAAVGGLAGRWS